MALETSRPPSPDPAGAPAVDLDELEGLARAHGVHRLGVAPAAPLLRARRALVERKAAGLHAGMRFTYKNPVRSTDPTALVRGARSVVVGARSYHHVDPAPPGGAQGRVARYARRDAYGPLREGLRAVADRLRSAGHRAVVFADDNALVDREVAYLAGIGWFGKNTNLLLPGSGSWYVLGSVVTDAALPLAAPIADGCGACRRCIDGCPTGAIVAPGVVDARRCLAWLVQQPGEIPEHYREAMGDRIYGCDDCQEVCPPNRRLPAPDGSAGQGGAPVPGEAPVPADAAWVDLLGLLSATDAELLARHGRWYIADRDPRWLRRNALVALGNVGDPDDAAVRDAVHRYATGPDDLLAAHARWAASRLAARR
jgi:epoxyqueuosine reductase